MSSSAKLCPKHRIYSLPRDAIHKHGTSCRPAIPNLESSPLFMRTSLKAEQPRWGQEMASHIYVGGACFLVSTMHASHPKGAQIQRCSILGFTLFMFTPFDVERSTHRADIRGRGLFLEVSHAFHPKVAWPQRTPIWGFSPIYAHMVWHIQRPNSPR